MRSEREDGWDNLSSFSYQFSDLIWGNLHVVKRKVSCSPRSESSSCSRAMTLAVGGFTAAAAASDGKSWWRAARISCYCTMATIKWKWIRISSFHEKRDWSQQHDDAAHSTEQGSNFKLKLTSSSSLRGWDQTQIFAFYEIFRLEMLRKSFQHEWKQTFAFRLSLPARF